MPRLTILRRSSAWLLVLALSFASTRSTVASGTLATEAAAHQHRRPAGEGTTLPPGFVNETVISGLPLSTAVAWAADGRLFIAVKSGQVLIYENGALLPTPFIDISAQVNNWSDRGLNGMALHPDFPKTPYVYLWFTYDPPDLPAINPASSPDGTGARASRLIRVSADPVHPSQALPGSEVVLLGTNSTLEHMGAVTLEGNGPQPYPAPGCVEAGEPVVDCFPVDNQSHSTGQIRFGSDDTMYVSHGDGGHHVLPDYRSLRTLDLDSLAGKVLRVDPATGLGLPNNPFYDGDPASNRSRVLAYGLRNPYRIALNPDDGELFIGDVGWGAWEEVNRGFGKNFGWPCYEGASVQPGYATDLTTASGCQSFYGFGANQVTPPTYTYALDPTYRGAIIVGDFYSGNVFPAEYQGLLFFADYTNNWIKTLRLLSGGGVELSDFMQGPVGVWNGPVQILNGPDGNLYFLTVYAGGSDLHRIRYAAGQDLPPTAVMSANPTNGGLPLVVDFSAAGSIDPESQPLAYQWAFGDGGLSTALTVTHTYVSAGTYTAVLTVTDQANNSTVKQALITAGNHAPVASITSPLTGTLFAVGDPVHFEGTGQDEEDGLLAGDNLQWSMVLHHDLHIHPDALEPITGTTGAFITPDHGDKTWMELCLTVIDSGGLKNRVCRPLLPATVQLGFRSQPAGFQVVYGGSASVAAFDVAVQVGAQRTFAALEPQFGRVFSQWSNGGLASQAITVTAAAVFTVTYDYQNPKYAWLPVIGR